MELAQNHGTMVAVGGALLSDIDDKSSARQINEFLGIHIVQTGVGNDCPLFEAVRRKVHQGKTPFRLHHHNLAIIKWDRVT
jgi:hypothetical protein